MSMTAISNTSSNRSQWTRFEMTHGNLRTLHAMQRQRYRNSMQKTMKNQEPAYVEPYDEVVEVGYECIPYHSRRTTYNREYNTYNTYYKIPTRQTTCHDAWMDKFKAWKQTIELLPNPPSYSSPAVPDPSSPPDEASAPISSTRRRSQSLIYL